VWCVCVCVLEFDVVVLCEFFGFDFYRNVVFVLELLFLNCGCVGFDLISVMLF
jgi:hypothetical protein